MTKETGNDRRSRPARHSRRPGVTATLKQALDVAPTVRAVERHSGERSVRMVHNGKHAVPLERGERRG